MADLGAIARAHKAMGYQRPIPNRNLTGGPLATASAVDVSHSISGTVLSAAGAYLSGVRVDLYLSDGTLQYVATTFSNASGAYSFSGLDNTISYTIIARDPSNTYNLARLDRVVPV